MDNYLSYGAKHLSKTLSVVIFCTLFNISCIDRETIAGTGKEIPDSIIGAGGDFQFGFVNSKLSTPLKVRVLAANGRPVRGIVVEFSVENSNAIFSDTNATTNGDGYAQTIVTLGSKADSVRISASVLGLKGSPIKFSLFAVSSSASIIELVSGNNQVGEVGEILQAPLIVKVTDFYNNPVSGVIVYFTTNNGTLQRPSTFTDSLGIASSDWKLDTIVGSNMAQIVVPSITNGIINVKAVSLSLSVPSYFFRLSNDTFFSIQGTTINSILKVRTLDRYKNPIYRQGLFSVKFNVTEGLGKVSPTSTGTNTKGESIAGVSIAEGDSILKISSTVGNELQPINFTFFAYKYSQIDSLKSSGGIVSLFWQKNLNPNFANYTLQRCNNYNFDNSTINLKVITDENIVTTDDNTAVVGSSPFYRIRINYSNGFYFYTNLRDVKVNP